MFHADESHEYDAPIYCDTDFMTSDGNLPENPVWDNETKYIKQTKQFLESPPSDAQEDRSPSELELGILHNGLLAINLKESYEGRKIKSSNMEFPTRFISRFLKNRSPFDTALLIRHLYSTDKHEKLLSLTEHKNLSTMTHHILVNSPSFVAFSKNALAVATKTTLMITKLEMNVTIYHDNPGLIQLFDAIDGTFFGVDEKGNLYHISNEIDIVGSVSPKFSKWKVSKREPFHYASSNEKSLLFGTFYDSYEFTMQEEIIDFDIVRDKLYFLTESAVHGIQNNYVFCDISLKGKYQNIYLSPKSDILFCLCDTEIALIDLKHPEISAIDFISLASPINGVIFDPFENYYGLMKDHSVTINDFRQIFEPIVEIKTQSDAGLIHAKWMENGKALVLTDNLGNLFFYQIFNDQSQILREYALSASPVLDILTSYEITIISQENELTLITSNDRIIFIPKKMV